MKTPLEIGVKITKMVFHIYKVNYKSVSTIHDECKGVELEISTNSKRKTMEKSSQCLKKRLYELTYK